MEIRYTRDRFLESPETTRAHFGWHSSLCIFKTKASRGTTFWHCFNSNSLYNVWKDHLYRISGSEFYEWLFVPEKFRDFRESYLIDWATIPKEKARQQSLSVVSCVGKRVEISLFRLNFSPNTSLDIPSLHNMSSLILKKKRTWCFKKLLWIFSG